MRLHNLIHLIVFSCVSGITHFHNAPTSHQQGLVNRATERQPGGPECQKAQIPSPKNCQTLSRIAECLQKYAKQPERDALHLQRDAKIPENQGVSHTNVGEA